MTTKLFVAFGLVGIGLITSWVGGNQAVGMAFVAMGIVVLLTRRWYLRALVALILLGYVSMPSVTDSEPGNGSPVQESLPDNTLTSSPPTETPETSPVEQMTALQQAEVAFLGNPPQSTIKAKLDRAMTQYNLTITEENYSRAGSTLVSLRKEYGHSEMDILDFMIQMDVPGANFDFPTAASLSVTSLVLGSQ
jgi:hypothetical protein